jgi:hypothetical protein
LRFINNPGTIIAERNSSNTTDFPLVSTPANDGSSTFGTALGTGTSVTILQSNGTISLYGVSTNTAGNSYITLTTQAGDILFNATKGSATTPGFQWSDDNTVNYALGFLPAYEGSSELLFGPRVTGVLFTQKQITGNGALVGVTFQITAQQGQSQTGANNNNNGGVLQLSGGAGGTGGSGTVGTSGSVQVFGAQQRTTRTVTGNTTVDSTATSDYTIFCNPSAGMTLTLPVPTAGRVLIIKDIGTAVTNNITVTPNTGTIDGAASYVINLSKAAIQLTSDGTNWWVTASYNGTVV